MRRIVKPILLGLLIGTAIMAIIYAWALIGYTPAVNLLLKLTMPPFNIAAVFLAPVAPDDLERGGQRIDTLLLMAWAQIGVISAVTSGAARAFITRKAA